MITIELSAMTADDVMVGDTVSWRVWYGATATAQVVTVDRWHVSLQAPDGRVEPYTLPFRAPRLTITRQIAAQS